MIDVRSRTLSLTVLCVAAAFSLAACSSAPKAPEAVFETANKAAALSKLGDGFMAKRQYSAALDYYRQARAASSSIDDIDKVTLADVQRVAKQYLIADTRTVAYLEQDKEPAK